MTYSLKQIGTVRCTEDGFCIVLEPEYIPALTGLNGFSALVILYWFHGFDNDKARSVLTIPKPYTKGPDTLGIFATRSPRRPNPIAVSPSGVRFIDYEKGVIYLDWIDALDGTPVLDIKPYSPCVDRMESATVPAWCSHWPRSAEESGEFDWEAEFNY